MPLPMPASNDSLDPRKPQSEEGFSPFATDRAEGPSIDPADVARFSAQAAEWWDPKGPFAPLHRFNPARLKFVRDRAAKHFDRDVKARAPFSGLSLIDIGCGGGLIAVVLTMEVIEHVADPEAFIRACSKLIKPGGLMIVATLNRTLKGLLLGKVAAEYVLRWVPAGTHDWRQFLKPDELRAMLDGEPLTVTGPYGLAYDPLNDRWSEGDDVGINYMMMATRDA